MKVLYSLDVFPKISETFILNEILEAKKQGIEIVVFSRNTINEEKKHERVNEVKDVFYSKKDDFINIFFNHLCLFFVNPLAYIRTLLFALSPNSGIRRIFLFYLGDIKKVNKIQPDLLHAHFGGNASDFVMLCKLLLNIDYTFTTHRWDIFDSPPKNYLLKTKLAKKHITISEFNKTYMIKTFNLPEEKVDVIHCGIDFDRPEFNLKKIKNKVPHLLNVGRLTKQKDQETLINVCKALKNKNIIFVCKIIGEGERRQFLENIICKYGMDKDVLLLGAQTQSVVFKELCQTDIFVLTSNSEGIPVSLMEAMAMDVPVVSTNVNGIPELIDDGVNGYLCDIRNVDMFVEKITRVFNSKPKSGYEKVFCCFNIEKEVEKLVYLWSI